MSPSATMAKEAKEAIVENDATQLILSRKDIENIEDYYDEKVLDEDTRLATEKLWKGVAEIPKNWNDMTVREQRNWMRHQVDLHLPNVPRSLTILIAGLTILGDCGRSPSAPKPDWLDHEKFLRGQKFAMDHLASVFLAEVISLCGIFSFENALKPLIITGKSSDPYAAFKRYLSTANRVKSWYSSDPWTEGTTAHKDIIAVRKMHANVRSRLSDTSIEDLDKEAKIEKPWSTTRPSLLEDFRKSCPAAVPGQCPYAFSKEEQFKRPVGLNQSEMAATQSGFVGMTILYPEHFGIHGATDEDLDAFCHMWRGLGHLLGMEDEYNFCNGTLDEVKQRTRDFIEYWVKPNFRDVQPEWEHMLRCLMTGIRYYFPSLTYEHGVLYYAELINIRLPTLEASLDYTERFRYKMMKITLYWTSRLPWVSAGMKHALLMCMDRGLKYSVEQHDKLKKNSSIVMSTGKAEAAAPPDTDLEAAGYSRKNSVFFLLSTCILLSLPFFVKQFDKMFWLIDSSSALSD